MKVITVVGTRPELIRLSRIIALLDEKVEHVLVHTGQNASPALNDVFFDELGIRPPDYSLHAPSTSLGAFLGSAMPAMEDILVSEKPDAFMVLGDTNSALTSILAKRLHIPVYHLEAGNRSFDENVPEESNRRIVDHTADFNLVYSEPARRNLLSEGLHPRRITLIGSPMREVLLCYADGIHKSEILAKLSLQHGAYFLVSAHRQENVDNPRRLRQLANSLDHIAETWDWPVVVSVHPRTRARLAELDWLPNSRIKLLEPFGFFDYIKLQQESACVLSDSGTVSEESAILGFPAVTIRASMERPEALETGVLLMSDLDPSNIENAIRVALDPNWVTEVPPEYMVENSSFRAVNFLLSTAGLHKFWSGLRTSR